MSISIIKFKKKHKWAICKNFIWKENGKVFGMKGEGGGVIFCGTTFDEWKDESNNDNSPCRSVK